MRLLGYTMPCVVTYRNAMPHTPWLYCNSNCLCIRSPTYTTLRLNQRLHATSRNTFTAHNYTTTSTTKLFISHILLFYYSTISTLYFFLFLSLLCSTSHPAQHATPHNTAQHDITENIWSFFASDLIHTQTQASRQTDKHQTARQS